MRESNFGRKLRESNFGREMCESNFGREMRESKTRNRKIKKSIVLKREHYENKSEKIPA
jgi:hypothetical protein